MARVSLGSFLALSCYFSGTGEKIEVRRQTACPRPHVEQVAKEECSPRIVSWSPPSFF